jgi:citrate synthase
MSNAGLEGIVVAQTKLSAINGETGELIYGGYDIDDLARNTTFEEVTYLLWNNRLPTESELNELAQEQLAAEAPISDSIVHDCCAPSREGSRRDGGAPDRRLLPLHGGRPKADDNSDAANRRKAIRMTAKLPTIIAAFDRIRKGSTRSLRARPQHGRELPLHAQRVRRPTSFASAPSTPGSCCTPSTG